MKVLQCFLWNESVSILLANSSCSDGKLKIWDVYKGVSVGFWCMQKCRYAYGICLNHEFAKNLQEERILKNWLFEVLMEFQREILSCREFGGIYSVLRCVKWCCGGLYLSEIMEGLRLISFHKFEFHGLVEMQLEVSWNPKTRYKVPLGWLAL